MIAVAILVALAVGGWLAYRYLNAKPAEANLASPAVVPPKAVTPAPSIAAAAEAVRVRSRAQADGASPELLRKIQELRDAGNFNVLVLYLVEWTRKEPSNPTAWDQLRAGYATLKQYEDALAAAKKAQELLPEDAGLWHKLGVAYADAGDPVGALRAFDQAVARDDQDADVIQADRHPERATEPDPGSRPRVRQGVGPPSRRSRRAVHAHGGGGAVVSFEGHLRDGQAGEGDRREVPGRLGQRGSTACPLPTGGAMIRARS